MQGNDSISRIRDIEARLESLAEERGRLVAELTALRAARAQGDELSSLLGRTATSKTPGAPEEKVELFLKLFRARESVFPRLWENHTKGIKGYSPACKNEWIRGVCGKPQVKALNVRTKRFHRWMRLQFAIISRAGKRSAPTPYAKMIPAHFWRPTSTAKAGNRT